MAANVNTLRKQFFVFIFFTLFAVISFIRFSDFAASNGHCNRKQNILFLKTHKTASSTIQNIFMRHAVNQKRILVLPLLFNYLGHPQKFRISMAPKLTSGHHYSVFTHHSRFNYQEMKNLMPSDTFFVTILREPVSLFESLYDYYDLKTAYKITIEQFATLYSANDALKNTFAFKNASVVFNTGNGMLTSFNSSNGISTLITSSLNNSSNNDDFTYGVVTVVNNSNSIISVLNPLSGLVTIVNSTDGLINIYNITEKFINIRKYDKVGRNQMSFDLGIDPVFFDFDGIILEKAKEFEQQFGLVMISELFSESLVLLQHELCWDVDDIVAFKHNSRPQSKKLKLSPETANKLREINQADRIIYDYFYKKLQERIGRFGKFRMELAVKELNKRISYWHNLCVASDKVIKNESKNDEFQVANDKVTGFEIRKQQMRNEMCVNMAKSELPFTKELLHKQMKFFTEETLFEAAKFNVTQWPFSNDEISNKSLS